MTDKISGAYVYKMLEDAAERYKLDNYRIDICKTKTTYDGTLYWGNNIVKNWGTRVELPLTCGDLAEWTREQTWRTNRDIREVIVAEWKGGYKVVYIVGDKCYSANLEPEVRQEYGLDFVTERRPGWGSLAVFSTIYSARYFCDGIYESGRHIFPCYYKKSQDEIISMPRIYGKYRVGSVHTVIHDDIVKTELPLGSCFADKVILTRFGVFG